ncbi:hypothetical protein IMY05_005G0080000 [Salix suchowensis]|nr:hypothetical protein IMY05_005G0080000 [Salix suchowensis]
MEWSLQPSTFLLLKISEAAVITFHYDYKEAVNCFIFYIFLPGCSMLIIVLSWICRKQHLNLYHYLTFCSAILYL